MSASDTPMSDVIAMAASNGTFDDTVAGQLNEQLGSKTVGQIGATKFELAKQLSGMTGAFKVAGDLLDFMREAELIGLPNAAAPAAPQTVTVVMPKTRDNMGLAELFTELTEHPEDTDELIDLIRRQNAVVAANTKLRGSEEWAIPNADNSLNVAETLEYIRHLASRHTQPQRKWKSQYWPTTLERALGRDQRIMLYPFTNDPRELLLVGPDKFGNDWSKLSDSVHEAVIAAVASGKLVVRSETDVRRTTHELFDETLPAYLQDLVEEYERDKARGLKVERYATPEQLRAAGLDDGSFGSRRPFGAEPERDDAWYEAQLREECGRAIDVGSGSDSASRCIVPYVSVRSGSAHLNEVISLGNVTVNSGNISGTGWAPNSATVHARTGTLSRGVQTLSWKKLYAKAVELGIIEQR